MFSKSKARHDATPFEQRSQPRELRAIDVLGQFGRRATRSLFKHHLKYIRIATVTCVSLGGALNESKPAKAVAIVNVDDLGVRDGGYVECKHVAGIAERDDLSVFAR